MIQKILDSLKKEPLSPIQWMLAFTCIMVVRVIFEAFSNTTLSGVAPSDPYTMIHYGLFFLAALLGFIFIAGYFVKDYIGTGKVFLFAMPIIWLAPVLDLIISRGAGYKMTYLMDSHVGLISDFFKFWSPKFIAGATYGMRLEIAFILIGIGIYVWLSKKDLLKSFLAVLLSYTFLFILGTIPGIIFTFTHLSGQVISNSTNTLSYILGQILNSNILHNTFHESFTTLSMVRFLELGFNKLLSQILFIISFVLGMLIFWKITPEKFKAVLKNSRPERIALAVSLLAMGMGLAFIFGKGILSSWIDIFGIISLLLSWFGLWMHAVSINDIADMEIDKVSNTGRPLARGGVTKEEMQCVSYLWLSVALLGSWSAGFYPFFLSLVFLAISYIYSVPPLRYKRVPFFSSFLLSLAYLSTILAGFFFLSVDKAVAAFPISLAAGIVLIFTLGTNIRDMKDIEGDKKEGVMTLPILFGKNGPRVVGLCLSLSFLLVPLFLSTYILYILAVPFAFVGYKLIVKKPYREKPIFILYGLFISIIVAFMASAYIF